MLNLTLKIANLELTTAYKNAGDLPGTFKSFRTRTKKSDNNMWHLKSVSMDKTDNVEYSRFLKKKIYSIKERFKLVTGEIADWKKREDNFLRFVHYSSKMDRFGFYLNDPVQIDINKKIIKHFYRKEDSFKAYPTFDSRLITFAYSQILASMQGILLHCTCVVKDKKAFLFFAPSGGGKSTAAKLSKRYTVLGDDIIALRKIKNNFFAFSTPWRQKDFIKIGSALHAKIEAVFFLKKSKRIYFEAIRPEEALVRVLSKYIHFFLYTERPMAQKIFFTAADFFKLIPAHQMHFKKDSDFWPVLEKTTNENKRQ